MPADGLADSNDDIYIRAAFSARRFWMACALAIPPAKLYRPPLSKLNSSKGPGTFFRSSRTRWHTQLHQQKPTEQAFIKGEIATGSLGKERYSLDINQPFSRLNSRLILSDYSQNTSADVRDIKRQLVALSSAHKSLSAATWILITCGNTAPSWPILILRFLPTLQHKRRFISPIQSATQHSTAAFNWPVRRTATTCPHTGPLTSMPATFGKTARCAPQQRYPTNTDVLLPSGG